MADANKRLPQGGNQAKNLFKTSRGVAVADWHCCGRRPGPARAATMLRWFPDPEAHRICRKGRFPLQIGCEWRRARRSDQQDAGRLLFPGANFAAGEGGNGGRQVRDAVLFITVCAPFRAHASPHEREGGQRGAHRARHFCTDRAAFCASGFFHGHYFSILERGRPAGSENAVHQIRSARLLKSEI